jgi:hypothetical protein
MKNILTYEKFKILETTTESEELTPHIKYWDNENVSIKGQRNSKGQREGLWEWFYPNGNIEIRTPYKEDKKDGIEEWFWYNGNIVQRIPYKEGKKDGIQTFYDEQGNITETYLWKDGELIEEFNEGKKPYSDTHGGLDKWFKEKWVDISKTNPDGSHPPCGRDDASKGGYPKCRKVKVAARMTKKQKKASVSRKRKVEKEGKKGPRTPNYSK